MNIRDIEDMSQSQLQTSIQNAGEVIRAAESGSDEYTAEQVEQAREDQQLIAQYLEQVGAQRIELKQLDTRSLQEQLATS